MANVEVGSAYVSVYPKADKGFNNSVGQEIGTSVGAGLSTKAVALGNIVSNAILSVTDKIADGIAAVVGGALENYANYEQLAGGVEKIFDEADIEGIFRDANEAYKDLNMSANEYLESINKTGAAFAQTMGDQRGYDVARQGMKAISDYASGTGRNIDELNEKFALITRSTSSYQSIADQFSGILPATSADFLAQAQAAGLLSTEYAKLTEVPIAEYQQALAAMLEKGVDDMGLLGNTAAESAETISGSLAMLRSSWQNFLTALATDEVDLDQMTNNLVESLVAVANNIAPRLVKIVGSIFEAIPKIIDTISPYIDEIAAEVSAFIEEHRDEIEAAGKVMFDGLTDALSFALEAAIQALGVALVELIEHIPEFNLMMLEAAGQLMLALVEGFVEGIEPAMNALEQAFDDAFAAIGEFLGGIGDAVASAVSDIAGGVVDTVSGMIDTAISVMTPIIDAVSSIFDGVKHAIEDPIGAARDFVSGIVDEIVGFFSGLGDRITSAIGSIHFPQPHIGSTDVDIAGVTSMKLPVVEWYARGGFVDNATLIGAGEAGREAIIPLANPSYMRPFAQAVAAEMGGAGTVINLNLAYDASDDAAALARGVARKLGAIMDMRG